MSKTISKKGKNRKSEMLWWVFAFFATSLFGFINRVPGLKSLFSTAQHYVLLLVFAIGLLFYCFARNKDLYFNGPLFKINFAMAIMVTIEVIISHIYYGPLGQPFWRTLVESVYYYITLLLCFAFSQRKERNDCSTMLNVFVKASILCGIIASAQYFLLSFAGLDLLNLASSDFAVYRYGTLRLSIGGFVVTVATVYSFVRIINGVGHKIDWVNLIFFFLQTVVYSKGRAAMIAAGALFGLMLLFNKRCNYILKVLGVSSIALVGLVVVLRFSSILTNLTAYIEADAGIMIRFDTIEYYWNQFLQKPIFGMGFITAHRSATTYSIMSGDGGYYFRDDVGIIGYINTFGTAGLIWFIAFIVKGIKLGKSGKSIYHQTAFWVVIYFLLTAPTLLMLLSGGVYSVAIMTCLFESVALLNKKASASLALPKNAFRRPVGISLRNNKVY